MKKEFFFLAAIDYSRRHEVEMEEGSRLYLSSPFVFDHDEREENYIFQINNFLRIARILLDLWTILKLILFIPIDLCNQRMM